MAGSTYTLTGVLDGTFQTKTLRELGFSLENCQLTLQSQDSDWLDISRPGAVDDADPFLFDHLYELKRDGTTLFVGRCGDPTANGAGPSESVAWKFEGVWGDLKETNAEQDWDFGTEGGTQPVTRIIFFQAASGAKVDTADTVAAAIEQARTLAEEPCCLQLGTDVPAGTFPPRFEEPDPPVANIVQKCLNWHPGTLAWIDYTTFRWNGDGTGFTAAPTLNFQDRATAPVVTLSALDKIKNVSLNPLQKLVPRGIVIRFVYTNADEEVMVRSIITQSAGETVGRRVIRETFTLDPGYADTAFLEQPVTTVLLPSNLSDPALSEVFWKRQYPVLGNALDDPTTHTKIKALTEIQWDTSFDHTLYQYELTKGTVQDWMTTGEGVHFLQNTLRGKLAYSYTDQATSLTFVKTQDVVLNLTLCSTPSHTFRKLDSSSALAPEAPPPVNLAELLLAQLQLPHYQGSLTLVDQDVRLGLHLGKVVNLTSGRDDWATMKAQIQQISYNLGRGETQLTFGPPALLAAPDWLALLAPSRIAFNYTRGAGGSSKRGNSGADAGKIPGPQDMPGGVAANSTAAYENLHVAEAAAAGVNKISLISKDPAHDRTTFETRRGDKHFTITLDDEGSGAKLEFGDSGTDTSALIDLTDAVVVGKAVGWQKQPTCGGKFLVYWGLPPA